LKKSGFIKPNKTIFGKIVLDNYIVPGVFIFSYVLSTVPWDRQLVEAASYMSINIIEISNSSLSFSQYAISYLAFISVVGTLSFILSICFGVKHMRLVREEYGVYELHCLGMIEKAMFLLVFISCIGVLLWGVVVFSDPVFL